MEYIESPLEALYNPGFIIDLCEWKLELLRVSDVKF
jgi:hypothetical protein